MPLFETVRSSLSLKVSLTLSALMLVITAAAAWYITAHQAAMMQELTLDKARLAATVGAREYGDTLEQSIDSGLLTVNEAFDRDYKEIKGWDWGGKPKFHTRFDAITDRAMLPFQEKMVEFDDFVYAVGVDDKGYLPTHNVIYQQPLTGDPKKDAVGNRSKRMFNNEVELRAAQSLEPVLVQVYHRDTGATMWDVSSPIWVKGRHWGAFRVGASMEKIEVRQRGLLWELLLVFGIFAAVANTAIFVMIQRAMRPVAELTRAADSISMGEGLDVPIRSDSSDEIGRLTKAVERLRASMKAAMSRLGE